jgi:hypothetical protein
MKLFNKELTAISNNSIDYTATFKSLENLNKFLAQFSKNSIKSNSFQSIIYKNENLKLSCRQWDNSLTIQFSIIK